jgi:hypothetical protein
MPRVGFEPTTPVFERAKIVHASDCAASVTGNITTQAGGFVATCTVAGNVMTL